MFDTGCQNFVCRNGAVDLLPDTHKENIVKGPILILGVGCKVVESTYGQYSVKLHAYNGKPVKFTGICLDMITGVMPPYPVREASQDVIADYVDGGGKESDLPLVPMLVGGETDFLIGLQYNYYQPRLIHILPTGLAIYKSMFVGVNNTRGCIGGPHKVFEMCEQQFMERSNNNIAQFKVFLHQQIQLFNLGFRVCLDSDTFTLDHNQIASLRPNYMITSDSVATDMKNKLLNGTPEDYKAINSCLVASKDNATEEGEIFQNIAVVDMDNPRKKTVVLV